jgi:DNA polymerase
VSLHIDFETRSPVDIKKRGAYVYAEHPDTIALLASMMLKPSKNPTAKQFDAENAWRLYAPEDKIVRWSRGDPCPQPLRAYIEAGGEIKAHNAQFERLIFRHVTGPKNGWPVPRLEQFRCTAVTAAAMGLPRSLDRLGAALGLKVKKDKDGVRLMHIHSIPIGFQPDGSAIWHGLADDPASLEKYHAYCDTDVLTEAEADSRLIPLSDAEMQVYWLNEKINDRGLRIDVESARAAIRLAEKAKDRLNRELAEVTGRQVAAVTLVSRLKDWCASQGFPVEALDKDSIDDYLHLKDVPAHVQKALEIRAEGAKPSVDKIHAMLERCSADGRARGVYLHHGAGQTGRFSSRGVQAHNMPRYRKMFEDAHLDLTTLFNAIRTGEPETLELLYGPDMGRPLHLLADAVRSFIWSAPGHDMLVADYSSIEGRLAPWFSGEEWKIRAYEALDRGEGFGIYELAAAGIYGLDVREIDKQKRMTGKVAELSLSYEGGVGALSRMARTNKLKLATVFPALWESTDDQLKRAASDRFDERIKKHDETAARLGREGWIAGELTKVGWRAKHPKIVESWGLLEEAAIDAVTNPGKIVAMSKVQYVVAHGFLWCRLPSGRCLAYGMPEMREVEAPWADRTLPPEKREKKYSLTVRSVESQTEKWSRFPVYGGALYNNCLSAETNVLTPYGWKPIINVEPDDLVHDGHEFVRHGGVVFQGLRPTISVGGVRMTPEHKVWTDDGWRRAEDVCYSAATASSDARYVRRALGIPDGLVLRWREGWKKLLARALRLWPRTESRWRRASAEARAELRLQDKRDTEPQSYAARHVSASSLYLFSQHARALFESSRSGVQKLWRSRHSGVRAVESLRDFLARHGTYLERWTHAGAEEQQRGLLTGKLRVGNAESAGEEHKSKPLDRHAKGANAAVRCRSSERPERDDHMLQSRSRLAGVETFRPARPGQKNNVVEPVFDVLNAGPRHRFVVRGDDGSPFIVSNCIQGMARDILCIGMLNAERAGYKIVLHTHDEPGAEVPCGFGSVEAYEKLICDLPSWTAGLPLTASGFRAKRYRKN